MKNITNIATSTMNSNKRTFRWGKHNAHAQTVRAGCSLAGLLAALALAFLTPRVAMGSVQVDVGTQTVIGDDATPQTIYLFVNNSGAPITVGSLDFYIQLGDGTGTTPSISSVDLLTGTIFSAGSQNGDINNGPQLQFYGVTKASGPGPAIPSGQSQLAAISFVTTGTASGSFSLSLSTSGGGNTDYFTDTSSPTGIGLSLVNGTLDVVAVPEPVNMALSLFGGLAVLVGGLRRWPRRKAIAGL